MKRVYSKAAVLFLALCILTVGCGQGTHDKRNSDLLSEQESISKQSESIPEADLFQTEEYLPEFDMQTGFTGLVQACQTEKAIYYYMFSSEFLWFYDKQTDIAGKLCGKPECAHDLYSPECNALLPGLMGLNYYDGWLYYAGMSQNTDYNFIKKNPYGLYRMNLQGTDVHYVQDLHFNNSLNDSYVILHRGYVYLSYIKEEISAGAPQITFRVARQKLGDSSSPEILFELQLDDAVRHYLSILGNQLYLFVQNPRFTENGLQGEDLSMYWTDIRDPHMVKIAEASMMDGFYTSQMSIHQGVPVFVRYNNEQKGIQIYRLNDSRDGFEQTASITTDQTYYPQLGQGVVVGLTRDPEHLESRPFVIYDMEGNLLHQDVIALPEVMVPMESDVGMLAVTASPDHIWVEFDVSEMNPESSREVRYYSLCEVRYGSERVEKALILGKNELNWASTRLGSGLQP
ncbi:MAG: hypothetical protein IJM90_05845 [Firmicutes bacterium]|nr:hypothetical protein [Bacillota bacterium]